MTGTAEAGSTVNLYTNSSCTSAVAGTGTAAAFASPGLSVAVADNTSTTYYATATDAAGNVSLCSSGITYVEDSTAPVAPVQSIVPQVPDGAKFLLVGSALFGLAAAVRRVV